MKLVLVLSFVLLLERVISEYSEYDLNTLCSDDHKELHALLSNSDHHKEIHVLLNKGVLIRIPEHFQSKKCLVTVYTAPSLNIAVAAEYFETSAMFRNNRWDAKIFFTSNKNDEVIDFHTKQRQQMHPSFKIFNPGYLNYSDIFYEYDWAQRRNLSSTQSETETEAFLSVLMGKAENFSDNSDYTLSYDDDSYVSMQSSTEISNNATVWSDDQCDAGEFQCSSYNVPHCVNSSFQCDGHVNCATVPHPDDEMHCNTTVDFEGVDVTQFTQFQLFSFISTVLLIMSIVLLLLLIISLLKVRQICLQKNSANRASASPKNLTFEVRSTAGHVGTVSQPPSYDSLFVNQGEEKKEKSEVNPM